MNRKGLMSSGVICSKLNSESEPSREILDMPLRLLGTGLS